VERKADIDAGLEAKLAAMQRRIAGLKAVAVAFSAGVDSTLVLKVALEVLGRERVLAVTARSPSVPREELATAARIAEALGCVHRVIDTREFADQRYRANPIDRCYYCKTTLYRHMRHLLRGHLTGYVIVNGTNADDLGDHRPGLRSAGEHDVVSPAADAGLTKADVRSLARALGLPNHDKPATPCLSSRVPYGEPVTPEKLRAIEAGERFLRNRFHLRECRVRHYGALARVEVPSSEVPRLNEAGPFLELSQALRALGFDRVEVDPRGFRSGSLNEVIAFGRPQDPAG
jgi:uncharacterized protein